uniref:hypothetical protein n=1 Tax=Eubacterium cellulosolvens TaxID=29322 RepID=UPI0012DFB696|nr:hypothetical protein [[Eubacterium] cellulosolvens]
MEDEKKEITEQGKAPEKDSTEVKKTARKKTTAKKASDEQTAEKKPAAKRKTTKKTSAETAAASADAEVAGANPAEGGLVDPAQMPTTPAEMKKTRKKAAPKTKAAVKEIADAEEQKISAATAGETEPEAALPSEIVDASLTGMVSEVTEGAGQSAEAAAASANEEAVVSELPSPEALAFVQSDKSEEAKAGEVPSVEPMQTQVLPNAAALRAAGGRTEEPAVTAATADTTVIPSIAKEPVPSVQQAKADGQPKENSGESAVGQNDRRPEAKAAQYVIKPDETGRNTYVNSAKKTGKKSAKQENAFLEWLSDNLRYIELGAVLVIAIVVIVFGIVMIRRNSAEKTGTTGKLTPVTTSQSETVVAASSAKPTVTPAPTGIVLPADALTEQTDGPINAAVQSYFSSLDTTGAVNGIVAYSDIQVYAYPGSSKDSYIAFAKYNYKYSDYNATVPALTELFIRVQKDGSMKVETEISDAESAYMNAAAQSQAAQSMISNIQTQYDQVMSSNTDLADYIASQQ